jgi:hypothetical protein
MNLNGPWDYAVAAKDAERPNEFEGKLLVPFPIESALSGVTRRVGQDERLWYRRTFQVPDDWNGQRLVLHFGAVDWDTTVWVNGREVGKHRGGYDPFQLDITAALKGTGDQELVVAVWDPTDKGPQPRGKQVTRPGGIYYTPVTGIWQTVWLEPLPKAHIRSLKIVPDVDRGRAQITVESEGTRAGHQVVVRVTGLSAGEKKAQIERLVETGQPGRSITLAVGAKHLWSPDAPWLYEIEVTLTDGAALGETADQVAGYFGMRKASLGKDDKGVTRVFFNNEPLFMFGPLDQGFWPDGIYTAPTDEALRWDIELTRSLGFNMCRKHVKVEPARWYYWCDRLGLLVWQDMPSGDASVAPGRGEITRRPAAAEQFERELKAMIDGLHNHPSIVMWVVFNEGWGQYDTVRLTEWVKSYDPTRLANCASGWNDFPAGDVIDVHSYPGPGSPQPTADRAAVLGEYGGLGLPVEGHTLLSKDNWGYRSFTDAESLTTAYLDLVSGLRWLTGEPGLSAAVYTQTTDVETEVNGLVTYDREVLKMDRERIAAANRRVYLPPPKVRTLVADSRESAQTWRYTTREPAKGWAEANFDDSSWQSGPGGFGTKETPGTMVRTEWSSPEIWIRRRVELAAGKLANPQLVIHHDEDADVYINGVLAAKVAGYTTRYVGLPIRPEARKALRAGRNVIAVHCKQTGGGQYIDVGLADVVETVRE